MHTYRRHVWWWLWWDGFCSGSEGGKNTGSCCYPDNGAVGGDDSDGGELRAKDEYEFVVIGSCGVAVGDADEVGDVYFAINAVVTLLMSIDVLKAMAEALV
ncbi:Hypothetical predicted protein [Octopus vulgaris]|uniref:Uncharacterized protein n=1 Tax=Octopus vulgaris TaxID=6645 RepID=A0AA36B236_OCTVU|nr:Hypothetical predicted protein [Octopus vulgaris]